MHITINGINTMSVEDWSVIPDDRQTQIQTVGGVVVQDFGVVEEGEKYSCTVTLPKTDAETIKGYWKNRTLVTLTDEGGEVYENVRVIVKRYGYLTGFKKYMKMGLEFWRV